MRIARWATLEDVRTNRWLETLVRTVVACDDIRETTIRDATFARIVYLVDE